MIDMNVIELWYNDIQHLNVTPPTIFVPLYRSEALAMIQIFSDTQNTSSPTAPTSSTPIVSTSTATTGEKERNIALMNAIERRIDEAIAKMEGKAAFVKLSCRSPKVYIYTCMTYTDHN
jgi:hypothetical protein